MGDDPRPGIPDLVRPAPSLLAAVVPLGWYRARRQPVVAIGTGRRNRDTEVGNTTVIDLDERRRRSRSAQPTDSPHPAGTGPGASP